MDFNTFFIAYCLSLFYVTNSGCNESSSPSFLEYVRLLIAMQKDLRQSAHLLPTIFHKSSKSEIGEASNRGELPPNLDDLHKTEKTNTTHSIALNENKDGSVIISRTSKGKGKLLDDEYHALSPQKARNSKKGAPALEIKDVSKLEELSFNQKPERKADKETSSKNNNKTKKVNEISLGKKKEEEKKGKGKGKEKNDEGFSRDATFQRFKDVTEDWEFTKWLKEYEELNNISLKHKTTSSYFNYMEEMRTKFDNRKKLVSYPDENEQNLERRKVFVMLKCVIEYYVSCAIEQFLKHDSENRRLDRSLLENPSPKFSHERKNKLLKSFMKAGLNMEIWFNEYAMSVDTNLKALRLVYDEILKNEQNYYMMKRREYQELQNLCENILLNFFNSYVTDFQDKYVVLRRPALKSEADQEFDRQMCKMPITYECSYRAFSNADDRIVFEIQKIHTPFKGYAILLIFGLPLEYFTVSDDGKIKILKF